MTLLRIDAPANRLRPIPVGTSKELQVGQSVFASDNPFGLDQPLTGVINALGFAIPLGTIARIVPELIRT
jgi:S1-C subfamily serine protease